MTRCARGSSATSTADVAPSERPPSFQIAVATRDLTGRPRQTHLQRPQRPTAHAEVDRTPRQERRPECQPRWRRHLQLTQGVAFSRHRLQVAALLMLWRQLQAHLRRCLLCLPPAPAPPKHATAALTARSPRAGRGLSAWWPARNAAPRASSCSVTARGRWR